MNSFKVIRRNGRAINDTLYEDICKVVNDEDIVIYKSMYLPGEVDGIYNAMKYVEQCFHQVTGVKDIGFEITIDELDPVEAVFLLDDLIMYLGNTFYTIGTIKSVENGSLITILVHTTSYRTGEKFQDNNKIILALKEHIEEIVGTNFVSYVGTYFSGATDNKNCYI